MLFLVARRIGWNPRSIARAVGVMFRPCIALVLALACWVALSAMDRIFVLAPVALSGDVSKPASLRPDLANKRISLALSGGGYRAALLHAGVVIQLNELGVPVTNIVSVSGGSIIGAFLAAGGDPADFVKAVREGRFRLMRELTSALEFPRWFLPFTGYTRRDVQAAMLRRTLLPAQTAPGRGPDLMIAMTDLVHVMNVGQTQEGLMFAGPTSSRFYRRGDALEVSGFGDLADTVAVSGAFPGAFPAKPISLKISRQGQPLSKGVDVLAMDLVLSDGGIRDNLGLNLLEAADAHQRGENRAAVDRPALKPGPQWAQDIIIVSDGGAAMSVDPEAVGLIDEVSRAIDIASLETGIVRQINTSAGPPKRFLSLPGLIAPYPDSLTVSSLDPNKAYQRFFFFRPRNYDQETLERIVSLAPNRTVGTAAMDEFLAAGDFPINVDVDAVCRKRELKENDKANCAWWHLVTTVGSDIENAADVFRSSGTLRDDYSPDEVSAIVRLGRYFVLLNWRQLDACLSAVGRDAPDARLTCVM